VPGQQVNAESRRSTCDAYLKLIEDNFLGGARLDPGPTAGLVLADARPTPAGRPRGRAGAWQPGRATSTSASHRARQPTHRLAVGLDVRYGKACAACQATRAGQVAAADAVRNFKIF
jgi:hypothetical protein